MPSKRAITIALAVIVPLSVCWLAFVNYLDYHEVGIARNIATGKLTLQRRSGFHVTAPWVQVASVDTRPQRVCVTSAGRGFNCKLVEFVPDQYKEFVRVEGFRYYWWANRISFNGGYAEEYRGMRDLLRGYAYDVVHRPFVKVLRSYDATSAPP